MKIFGLAGWSGSGKTTLLERLIPEWTGRGLKVSTVKHAHHAFDVDQPGKDSYRHRAANSSPWLYPDDPMIQGIAADVPADTDLPWFDLDDAPRIAGFIWEIAPAL